MMVIYNRYVLASSKIKQQLEKLEQTDADVAYGDWHELRATPDGIFVPGRLVVREMFLEAAITLAAEVSDSDLAEGRVYPPLHKIRDVFIGLILLTGFFRSRR